jgi:hypothetical protein
MGRRSLLYNSKNRNPPHYVCNSVPVRLSAKCNEYRFNILISNTTGTCIVYNTSLARYLNYT